MKRLGKQGFSMIELLVVLLIIGILAAVAAPLFLANVTKAEVSEAVSGAGSIRSGERSYDTQNNVYLGPIASSETGNFATGGTNSALLGVTIHGNKYFSPASYAVDTTGTAVGGWPHAVVGVTATPVDFTITVTGSASVPLATDGVDGASAVTAATLAGNPVFNVIVQMDNAGQTIYTSDGVNWFKY